MVSYIIFIENFDYLNAFKINFDPWIIIICFNNPNFNFVDKKCSFNDFDIAIYFSFIELMNDSYYCQ